MLGKEIPLLNGILVPDSNVELTVGTDLITQLLTAIGAPATLTDLVSTFLGTLPTGDLASISVGPFGGLVGALVNVIPQDILTADPGGTSILSGLDPSTLLSGLDLGNLGGLLDSGTLAGDLTSLLPSAAADFATLIPF